MEDTDLLNLLIEKLNFYYNSEYHSVVDLSMRDVTGDKGSLCGLAALYQAAVSTLLTVSHIKLLSYDDVRKILAEEMYSQSTAALKDDEFLVEFNKCMGF